MTGSGQGREHQLFSGATKIRRLALSGKRSKTPELTAAPVSEPLAA